MIETRTYVDVSTSHITAHDNSLLDGRSLYEPSCEWLGGHSWWGQ